MFLQISHTGGLFFIHEVHSSALTTMESVLADSKLREAANRVLKHLQLVVSVHVVRSGTYRSHNHASTLALCILASSLTSL